MSDTQKLTKTAKTAYSIYEVSEDGLLKVPEGYNPYFNYTGRRFHWRYDSLAEVDAAIAEDGDEYTDYVVLMTKRIELDLPEGPA